MTDKLSNSNTSPASKPIGIIGRLRQSETGSQFLRFVFTGLFATVLQYAIMISLVEQGLKPLWLCSALAYAIAAGANFLLARLLVFSSKVPWAHAGLRYLAMVCMGLLLNTLVFHIAASVVFYMLAQILATIVVFIFNFFVSKYWVHAHHAH